MAGRQRSQSRPVIPSVIWPGFVDALTGVLLVLVFTVSTFVLVQFFLRDELAGRNETIARLEQSIANLADTLALEQQRATNAEDRIAILLNTLASTENDLAEARSLGQEGQTRIAELTEELAEQRKTSEEAALALTLDLEAARQEAERVLLLLAAADAARSRLADESEREEALRIATERELSMTRELQAADRQRVALLNRQVAALREQLLVLQSQLDAAERRDDESQATIENLGQRLNAALAQKVSELARFRSEFFGRVREALGNRADIRIIGDRFVFESGVLFASASAEIGPEGRADLGRIAQVLREIAEQIPTEIAWRIRVDGHTDRLPLRANGFYADNWELSLSRAMAVVRYFVEEEGLPAERFAATGFGEHAPIDDADTPAAYARNRRIELTLTSR